MPLEDVLVAVSRLNDREPVGAGFLVSPRLLLTCAHVVNQALGRDDDSPERPTEGDKVSVRFQTIGAPLLSAHVASGDDAWSPPPARRQFGADTCLLWLVDDPPMAMAPSDYGTTSN